MNTINENSRKKTTYLNAQRNRPYNSFYADAVYKAEGPEIDLGDNDMIKSMYMPFQFAARIGDLNMSQTIVKTVNVIKTIKVVATDGLFVLNWYSRDNIIRHYLMDQTTKKFNFYQDIIPDQNIQDNYDLNRFVTGGLMLQSATISGSNFNVAGVLVATKVQRLPDLYTLTYDQIPSYKMNQTSTLGNVPISEGVATLSGIDCTQALRPNKTENVFPVDYLTKVVLNSATSIFNQNFVGNDKSKLIVNGDYIINTDLEPTYTKWMPPNTWGRVNFKLDLTVIINTFSVLRLDIHFRYTSANPDGTTLYSIVTRTNYVNYAPNLSTTIHLEEELNDRRELDGVIVMLGPNYAGNSTLSIDPVGTKITMTYYDVYEENARGPSTLIAYQSVGVGQEIALSGVLNYEVVPDANLIRQIGDLVKNEAHPDDLKILKIISSKSDFKSVFTMGDYKKFLAYINTNRSFSRKATAFHAAGLMDFVKPIMKKISPYVGRTIGGWLNAPEIGQSIGTMIGNTMFARGQEKIKDGSNTETEYLAQGVIRDSDDEPVYHESYLAASKDEITLERKDEKSKEKEKKTFSYLSREWQITLKDKDGEATNYVLTAKMSECLDNITKEYRASSQQDNQTYWYEYLDEDGDKILSKDFVNQEVDGKDTLKPLHKVHKKVNVTFVRMEGSNQVPIKDRDLKQQVNDVTLATLQDLDMAEEGTERYLAMMQQPKIVKDIDPVVVEGKKSVELVKIKYNPKEISYIKRAQATIEISKDQQFAKENFVTPTSLDDFNQTSDKRIQAKQSLMGRGFNTNSMGWNLAKGVVVSATTGEGVVVELIINQDKPVKQLGKDLKGIAGWVRTKYTKIVIGDRIMYLAENLKGQEMIDSLVAAFYNSFVPTGTYYIQPFQNISISGPSFGLAFFALLNNFTIGPIYSGGFDKEGNLIAVGSLPGKYTASMNNIFVCCPDEHFKLTTEKVPRCFATEINCMALRSPSEELPSLYFVENLAQVQVINMMLLLGTSGVKASAQIRAKQTQVELSGVKDIINWIKGNGERVAKVGIKKEMVDKALKAYEENQNINKIKAIYNTVISKEKEGTGRKPSKELQDLVSKIKPKKSTEIKKKRRLGIYTKPVKVTTEEAQKRMKEEQLMKEQNRLLQKQVLELRENLIKEGKIKPKVKKKTQIEEI